MPTPVRHSALVMSVPIKSRDPLLQVVIIYARIVIKSARVVVEGGGGVVSTSVPGCFNAGRILLPHDQQWADLTHQVCQSHLCSSLWKTRHRVQFQ